MVLLTQSHNCQLKKKMLVVAYILETNEQQAKKRAKRRCRVRKIFSKRAQHGAFANLIGEMRLWDEDKYYNYFRMSSVQFDDLLHLVGPQLQKNDQFRTDVLSPAERLSITLR